MERKGISYYIAKESLIVFEALFQRLIDSDLGEDVELEISGKNRLGDFVLRVGFEGDPFDPYADGGESIEGKLLRGYDDKFGCSYRAGYNVITISVSRSYRNGLFACSVAALLALVAYVPLSLLVDAAGQLELLEGYVFPLETMYGNAFWI